MRSVNLEIGDYLSFVVNENVEQYCTELRQELKEYTSSPVVRLIYNHLRRIELELGLNSKIKDVDIADNVDRLKVSRTPKEKYTDISNFAGVCKEEFNTLYATLLVDGLETRAVYYDGKLVRATLQGVNQDEFDLLNVLEGAIEKYNPVLDGYGLVELRGVITCRANKNKDIDAIIKAIEGRKFDKLLFFVYDIYCDSLTFDTRNEMFIFLDNKCGFKTPDYWNLEYIEKEDTVSAIEQCSNEIREIYKESYDFECEYIEWRIDNRASNKVLHIPLINEGVYESDIQDIYWFDCKPYAIIDKVSIGKNSIDSLPLYSPINILRLESYIGTKIKFMYDDLIGGVICHKNGEPLSKEFIGDYLFN